MNQMVRLVGRVGGALDRAARCSRWWRRSWRAPPTSTTRIGCGPGRPQRVLPFRVMAPSTFGTFLRVLHLRSHPPARRGDRRDDPSGVVTRGRVRDEQAMTIDLDSTICRGARQEEAGCRLRLHQGARLPPARGDPGRAPARCSTPGCARAPPSAGTKRFVEELVARVRRGGATGPLVRARRRGVLQLGRSIDTLGRLGVAWSITVHKNPSMQAQSRPSTRTAWATIIYPDGGDAQVAETTYVTGRGKTKRAERRVRLVVRRTRLTDPAQRALWPDWRHHAFITDLDLPTRRGRPVPPRPRHGRARHPRPQGGRRPRALPVGPVLRQRRLARLRRARPQPHPMDRPTRRHPRPTTNSPSPAPSAPASSPFPAASSTAAGRLVLRLPERWPWATAFTDGPRSHLRALPLLT